MTGYVWSMVFLLDLLSVTVAYFTTAFFVAASVRLYQDLTAMRQKNRDRQRHLDATDRAAV